jgi:hypothetical protein
MIMIAASETEAAFVVLDAVIGRTRPIRCTPHTLCNPGEMK